jgi:hypothetical protein
MRFQPIIFALCLLPAIALAHRAPAVEDFVGIEVEHVVAPDGTEPLVNLQQEIAQIERVQEKPVRSPARLEPEASGPAPLTILTLACLGFLPISIWFMMLNHLKRKATIENASNIRVLEQYRRERELAGKRAGSERKAS